MLTALIRKDIRICRLPLIAGLLLLAAPYVFSCLVVTRMPLWEESTPASGWAVLLGTSCYFSLLSSPATLAMLSGCLIATERADRSAEFLAYLPPSRRQVLGSKAIVLASCTFAIWGINLCAALLANWLAGSTEADRLLTGDLAPLHRLAAIGVVTTGVGWCTSARFENTGPCVALAFASPLIVFAALGLTNYLVGVPNDMNFARVYYAACVVAGVTAFCVGTVYFLRRVEP